MSWMNVLKKGQQTSQTRMFLYEVFDIPYDIPLNIPHTFLAQFSHPISEGLITEERFEELMKKEPQEIIDTIKGWMERKGKYAKEYSQKPEVKAREREYRQTPEVKEKRAEYVKEYQQRPEIKERRAELERERYRRRKARKKDE